MTSHTEDNINKESLVSFELEFTPHKAEQPPQGMKLQE